MFSLCVIIAVAGVQLASLLLGLLTTKPGDMM